MSIREKLHKAADFVADAADFVGGCALFAVMMPCLLYDDAKTAIKKATKSDAQKELETLSTLGTVKVNVYPPFTKSYNDKNMFEAEISGLQIGNSAPRSDLAKSPKQAIRNLFNLLSSVDGADGLLIRVPEPRSTTGNFVASFSFNSETQTFLQHALERRQPEPEPQAPRSYGIRVEV